MADSPPKKLQVPAGLGTHRQKYSILRRHLTVQAAASGGDLRPWMKEAALWYVSQLAPPKASQLAQKLTELVRAPMKDRHARALLQNQAWLSFVKQIEEEAVTKARAIAETRLSKAVESHFDAIDGLMAKKDYKEIAKFTVPVLDRIWPREQHTLPAQIIQISLGAPTGFAAKNWKEMHAIEVTAVEEATPDETN